MRTHKIVTAMTVTRVIQVVCVALQIAYSYRHM